MTNNSLIHRLNYQWQASKHFNWTMVGQYDVNIYRHYKKLRNSYISFLIFFVYLEILYNVRGADEARRGVRTREPGGG